MWRSHRGGGKDGDESVVVSNLGDVFVYHKS